MILHIVNKSASNSTALQQCLAVMGANDTLLLIEDGVYSALSHSDLLLPLGERCKVLKPDSDARGISEQVTNSFTTITYENFVELVTANQLSQSWF